MTNPETKLAAAEAAFEAGDYRRAADLAKPLLETDQKAGAEALLYWRKMRRRLRLGLADPVVTNRFFLWGLGAGAAGVGSAVGIGAQLATGLTPLEIPWVTLSSSLHGLTAAIAMWLAFLPTDGYRRFLRQQEAALKAEGQALAAILDRGRD